MSVFIFSDLILYVHMPTLYSFLGILIALPFAFFFFVSGGRWMAFVTSDFGKRYCWDDNTY
jgi:uncharacterized membrane protein YccC